MKLSEVRVGSGVPVGDGVKRICERCRADVSNGLTICPECGSHLGDSHDVEPMSTSFDAELAKANLLRMRGEYRPAENLCLSILKRFPNSLAAHTLLGDIYSDQGQLEQAAQWYELALDLDPTSTNDRQKLEDMRAQIQEREHISSIEQLGLPEKRPSSQMSRTTMVVGVCLVLVVIMVFALRGKMAGSSDTVVIRTPIRATDESGSRADNLVASNPKPVTPPAATNDTNPPVETTQPVDPASFEDRALMQQINQQSTMGVHLVSVLQDPRDKTVILTYKSTADDDERRIGAMLAKAALDLSPNADIVSIRSMKNDRLSYRADVPRTLLAETETPEWQSKATSPDAWISYVLTKEWPVAGATDGTDGTTTGDQSTPPSTTTTTTGGSSPTGPTQSNQNGLNDVSSFTGVGLPATSG